MIKSCIFVLASAVLLATSAYAGVGVSPQQLSDSGSTMGQKNPLALSQVPQFKGLLDTSRFSFHNTLGVSFTSGAGGGLNQYYLNTITYKAAQPLTIQAQVGIENTMYGTPVFGSNSGRSTHIIVPNLGLVYQPKPNLRIEVQFSNMPSRYGYWGGYPY